MKKISIVWGICVVLIFGGLTVLGILYKDIRPYDDLKKEMERVAKEYIDLKKDFSLKDDESLKISLNELKDIDEKANLQIKIDECDGNVKITKGIFGFKYKTTLECKNYPK